MKKIFTLAILLSQLIAFGQVGGQYCSTDSERRLHFVVQDSTLFLFDDDGCPYFGNCSEFAVLHASWFAGPDNCPADGIFIVEEKIVRPAPYFGVVKTNAIHYIHSQSLNLKIIIGDKIYNFYVTTE